MLRSNTQSSIRQSTRSNSPFSDREPAQRTLFLAKIAKILSVPEIVGSVYCLGERFEHLDINGDLNEESSAQRPKPSGSTPYI